MDVLRSTMVLLGILSVTGCHHGYHQGDAGWCGPGYGACVPPDEGYYDGWALPSAPWDMDPHMTRRSRHHDRHRSRRSKNHGPYPPYGPEFVHGMPCGAPPCDVCDTCGVSAGAGVTMTGGVMAGSPCGCQSDAMPTGMMPGPVSGGAPCQSCQEQNVHHGMQPMPDSPPPAPASGPTPNCAHCNETTQWQQFPSAPASSDSVEQYYVPSTDSQVPGPLPQQKAGEPVQPVMWVPSSFDGR